MRRFTALALLYFVVPAAAWASRIDIVNKYGSVSISNAGIVSHGSQLVGFNGVIAGPGHSLGSVAFTTGALISGTIFGGGTFAGGSGISSFVVIGKGNWSGPKGVIFSGYFAGPVKWVLINKTGANLTFELRDRVIGQLWNGRVVSFATYQTISATTGQLAKGIGHIAGGKTRPVAPEPGTLGLIGTALTGIAGGLWRRARR